jgi:hypothetical protein
MNIYNFIKNKNKKLFSNINNHFHSEMDIFDCDFSESIFTNNNNIILLDYIKSSSSLDIIQISKKKKIYLKTILDEVSFGFYLFWDFEFRSSNYDIKAFHFFTLWHLSALRASFYDFLLKTNLLKDERQVLIDYNKDLRKRYRKAMNRDRKRLKPFWDNVLSKYFINRPKNKKKR